MNVIVLMEHYLLIAVQHANRATPFVGVSISSHVFSWISRLDFDLMLIYFMCRETWEEKGNGPPTEGFVALRRILSIIKIEK